MTELTEYAKLCSVPIQPVSCVYTVLKLAVEEELDGSWKDTACITLLEDEPN